MSAATITPPPKSPPRPLALRAPSAQAPGQAHPVLLSGLRADPRAAPAAPVIVARRDQDFVEGLLADLGDASAHAALLASTPTRHQGVPRLFQPVQRVFNLVVMEVFCDLPGQPRLDPRKIESSGFVLRRVVGSQKLAWLKAGTQVFGWEAVDESLDPAQDRRGLAVNLGHPVLNALAPSQRAVRTAGSARLAGAKVAVSEDVQPLFKTPPEVADGVARTLLFGTLRVSSGELTEHAATPPVFGSTPQERQQLADDLVVYLRQGGARTLPVPTARSFSTEQWTAAAQEKPSSLSPAEFRALDAQLGALLLQLGNEFNAFGSGTGPAAMQAALRQLQVESDVRNSQGQVTRTDRSSAYDFLLRAKAVLLDAVPGAALTLPDRWGAVSDTLAQAIFEASLLCLQQQFAQLLPARGRFEADGSGVEARYVVRAFIRLKPDHPGCPGRLVWSDYSEPFTIAPWFESSGAPVPVIPLPDLMDRAQLARVRPTVAFALPPKLAALLRTDAKDLRDGKGSGGNGLGLGWICSFSLPIITLCAFIVLNIFLQLFNLIFWWLPMLKICIPIPKAKE
ncbi:hypothetical protein LHU53_00940 [Rhodoferax sp. U2-2l]|uniref:hypothetical protein n=1 Tax=Rhodoferax sp. U2-2l TaxID=2884000 RepID=UPI001D0A690C|nr:hypothetical protein [Rhodoferax sp. U2-2l]MCB8745468.1 hypothetical protein [Rhodoferax sp. U2-2l]